ncbi:hypothetical protein O181_130157 [Austropuccinia psidii MF-1]|uniref:Uncharacterized protein n=1 Tax=Austropuccinia psidii MF-1 TaxID=1389203 RepID=A0A9Q3L0M3_9BASI|nr:hypothetical protein [Austropuccinia psidii MF-1]
MSSIREISSDSEVSESSIVIQPSPEPRGLITKEPFKGPEGHSSHKSKGEDCQPRGETQMEDTRTPTSSQRLGSTFNTLIESPEAEIVAIPVVRPESFLTGNNRNIPASIQELVYGGKEAGVEEVHGPRKDRGFSECLDTHVLQRTSPTDKSLVEKQKHVFRGPEEEVGPRKGQHPSGSSPSLHKQNSSPKVPNKGKKTQKNNQKGKRKAKPKWNKPYPQNHRVPKKEKTAMDNVFNMARTLMEFKNKDE